MTDRTISPSGSPLRRRMIEDMTIRRLAPKTQASYIRAVRNFTVFLGRSPGADNILRFCGKTHIQGAGKMRIWSLPGTEPCSWQGNQGIRIATIAPWVSLASL